MLQHTARAVGHTLHDAGRQERTNVGSAVGALVGGGGVGADVGTGVGALGARPIGSQPISWTQPSHMLGFSLTNSLQQVALAARQVLQYAGAQESGAEAGVGAELGDEVGALVTAWPLLV